MRIQIFFSNSCKNRRKWSFLGLMVALLIFSPKSVAQVPVLIDDASPHQILTFNQIDILEDATGQLGIGQVLTAAYQSRFKPSRDRIPKNTNKGSVYWYRFKIGHNAASQKSWMLEFFDQSIPDLKLFVPDGFDSYQLINYGTEYNFSKRFYAHKNFTHNLENKTNKLLTYYIRIKSPNPVSTIIVLRNFQWFLKYALSEYFIFGLFYGMIVVFCLYNLLMYFAVGNKKYLYYVLYNLSIGCYEMCNDGIAFQYLWPDYPMVNAYAFGIALYLSSIFGLLFTIEFLSLKYKLPKLYHAICFFMLLRTVFLVCCLLYPPLFNFKVIEILPLALAFVAAAKIYQNGFKPAAFLLTGYGFLLMGFVCKILLLLTLIPYNTLTYYSLSICFIVEMIVVSFAIGNSIRLLKLKKNLVQKRMIQQLQLNEALNRTLNTELQTLVDQRTAELLTKAEIIEKQNLEISVMNGILKKDNNELHLNLERVNKARVISKNIDFEEFTKIYPTKESCLEYLANLKWDKGYHCRKCSNAQFLSGQTPFSKRCTKCGYDESVIAYTIFQNTRIPLNKALYMFFLVYNSKGTISSYKLSQILTLRQSTCWTYNSKMQKVLQERKDEIKKAGEDGWVKIMLEPV